MDLNLDYTSKGYKLKFKIDEEKYIFKNNLTSFLSFGFNIKSAFFNKNCTKSKYLEFLNNYIEDKNLPIYIRLFSICLKNVLENHDTFNINDVFDNYILPFFEFHGILYDLCFFGFKNYDNKNKYFEKYVNNSKLWETENIFLKDLTIFNPFEYIIKKKDFTLPISFSTIASLCFYELEQMVDLYKKPKYCKNCNLFFVSSDSKKEYCDRIQKNGKTCFELANTKEFKNKQFNKKLKEDPYLLPYMNAYRKIHKNKYKNENNELNEQDKQKLKLIKKYLDEVRIGILDEEQYLELLKNINKKVTRK